MNRKDGGHAFPVLQEFEYPKGKRKIKVLPLSAGMSLRDFFAAKAMQSYILAMLTSSQAARGISEEAARRGIKPRDYHVWRAYQDADAMLAERDKEKGNGTKTTESN